MSSSVIMVEAETGVVGDLTMAENADGKEEGSKCRALGTALVDQGEGFIRGGGLVYVAIELGGSSSLSRIDEKARLEPFLKLYF